MAGKPATRLCDVTYGIGVIPPRNAITASPNVRVNGRAQLRLLDGWGLGAPCGPVPPPAHLTWQIHNPWTDFSFISWSDTTSFPPPSLVQAISISGSPTVKVNGLLAVRMDDFISDGDKAKTGSPNVFIGDQKSHLRWEEGAFGWNKEPLAYSEV